MAAASSRGGRPGRGTRRSAELTSPELSIIVTTHNRCDLLRVCLESLARQTVPVDSYEVVVVVDGSTDGTEEMLARLSPPFRLVVITQPQAGQSAARNAGAARAEGRVLVFVDDDEEADPGLAAAHLEAHRAGDRIAGVGVIERRVPRKADRLARLLADAAADHTARLAAAPITYLDAYGGNSSVAHSLFDEVGGYAVDLPRETDFEFAYRLHEAGTEFVFLAGAIVSEYRERPWTGILSDVERRGGIAVELYRRHPPIISTMQLGGHGGRPRAWAAVRTLMLALHLPPRLVALPSFLLSRRLATAWLRLVLDYCYWRGVKAAADRELWKRSRRGTVVLRYHAFGAKGERPSRYVVPGRQLERQLRWLTRRGYNVISLRDYLGFRAAHRFPPARSVVITIDDGYVDNDTIARPILERHGTPATVFLISREDTKGFAADPALAARSLLTLDRARRLLGGVIEFGAHTRTHPDLSAVDAACAREEIAGSKQDLERALGVPVDTFAYPYGEVNAELRRVVEEAGFGLACGVKPGHNRPATDSYDLRRIEVRGTDSLLRFAAMLVIGEVRFGR